MNITLCHYSSTHVLTVTDPKCVRTKEKVSPKLSVRLISSTCDQQGGVVERKTGGTRGFSSTSLSLYLSLTAALSSTHTHFILSNSQMICGVFVP